MGTTHNVFNYLCTIFSNIWTKFILTVTRKQLQASLNCQSCISDVSGSEIWDLWLQLYFFRPQLSGDEGFEENHLIAGSSQRMHYIFPTYCCLIQLDSINTADGCKKRIPICIPRTGIITDSGFKKETCRNCLFPTDCGWGRCWVSLYFFTDLPEKMRTFPLYKGDYCITMGWFWWHSCGLTCWEHIFRL